VEKEDAVASSPRSFLAPSFFNDRITVRFNQSAKGPLKIALYDARGVPVFFSTYASVPSLLSFGNAIIPSLASGVYFLRVDLNRQTETQKLIKCK
jgi:hypothetical protein